MQTQKIRVLLAKPGLDGHDRGAKVVAQALVEAGFEVIYTGLHQTVEQIAQAALQEDPDVIGLSILSGAHLPICQQLFAKLNDLNIADIPVVIGGLIPREDHGALKSFGVTAIYPTGTRFDKIAADFRALIAK